MELYFVPTFRGWHGDKSKWATRQFTGQRSFASRSRTVMNLPSAESAGGHCRERLSRARVWPRHRVSVWCQVRSHILRPQHNRASDRISIWDPSGNRLSTDRAITDLTTSIPCRGTNYLSCRKFQKLLVPKKGLEPPHPCEYMDLNHARLPIPPLRHIRNAALDMPRHNR